MPCPDGTWTPWTKATSASDCVPCPRGTFCKYATMYSEKASSLTTVAQYADPAAALGGIEFALYSGPCGSGYVCLEGASSPTPSDGRTGFICPVGQFCASVGGITRAIPCAHGYYAKSEGLLECDPCPAGTYCPDRGSSQTEVCPPGYYCPSASSAPTPCPAGTASAASGKGNVNECLPCEPGSYCLTPGSGVPTGPCAAGFVCSGGASFGSNAPG